MERKRVQSLLDQRNKELDKKVGAVAEARREAEAAGHAVSAAAEALKQAAERRLTLNRSGADWQTWVETQDWMTQQGRLFAQAQVQKAQCDRRVDRALAAVHKARSDVLRIEALIARIDSEQKKKEDRLERRREDEFQSNHHPSRQDSVR